MYNKRTPRLSREATEELLKEFNSPACDTPELKARSAKVTALRNALAAKKTAGKKRKTVAR